MVEENNQISGKSGETLPSVSNQPIRENLVVTAVHFLNNPKVSSSSLSHKTAFLQKKGLTEEEINLAFARTSANATISQQISPLTDNQVLPVPFSVKPHSVWYHIHRIGSSFIIIGIAFYGAHQIYKLYLEPWLFGTKADRNRISLMEQQMIEMNKTLSQLKQTVFEMQLLLNSQKEQANKTYQTEVNDYFPTPLVLNDLKAEVGSIKSLLLNRHQFPSIPKVSPTIPIWQMQVSDASSTQNNGENPKSLEDKNPATTSEVIVNGDMGPTTNPNDGERPISIDHIKTGSKNPKTTSEIIVNGDIAAVKTPNDAEQSIIIVEHIKTDAESANSTENSNSMNNVNGIEVTDPSDGAQNHAIDVDPAIN